MKRECNFLFYVVPLQGQTRVHKAMLLEEIFQENFKRSIQLFLADKDFSEVICFKLNKLVCIAFIRKLRCSLQLS